SLIEGTSFPSPVEISGAARDLRTGRYGVPLVLSAATMSASLDRNHTLLELRTTPAVDVGSLVGRPVGRGFRSLLDATAPAERDARTPLYLLLDELPVMLVISGYSTQYTAAHPGMTEAGPLKRDICSGWRSGGLMMNELDAGRAVPITIGPPTRRLEPVDDPHGWHAMDDLAPGAMRRRRLLDVRHLDAAGSGASRNSAGWTFNAYFRDSYRPSLAEPEIVLHEYELVGTLDAAGAVVTSATALPRVLPWNECPHAAASASWIVGHRVDAIKALVRDRFRGTDTCTHLNDLVRSLGDLGALVEQLR
ncbi:MAG: DUF2889 domain-containing protein, partial [Acidimicrobiia bacterium]